MAIAPLTQPFAAAQYGATSSTTTVCTLTSGVPVSGLSVVHFVQNTGTTADTLTVSDSKGNTYTVYPGFLASNSQTIVAVSKVATALVSGDTITVTSSTSRARRTVHIRGFSGADAFDAVPATSQALNSNSPSVTLTPPEAGCLVVATLGHNNSTGAMSWSGMTSPSTVSTSTGSSDKTLSDAYKIVSGSGSVTTSGTLDTAGPWSMVAVALKPTSSVTYEAGKTYQMIGGVWS